MIVGTANTADPVLTFQIPLGRFVDSILGIDKTQYFADTLFIKITWSATSQIGLNTTGTTNSCSEAVATRGVISTCALSNLFLFVAMEQNTAIQQELAQKAQSGTLTYQVPYTYVTRVTGVGPCNLSVRYNRANGRKLKIFLGPIYHRRNYGFRVLSRQHGLGDHNILLHLDQ